MQNIIELPVKTTSKQEMVDITPLLNKVLSEQGALDGICYVFVPHTTCGLTINEHADPSVAQDILVTLDKIVPKNANYSHLEGNSPAHIKSVLVGTSLSVFIKDRRLKLGTWQGVFLCEFDGPRQRKVWLKIIA
jgi:secondary thiamine-phosphate synthase enzyme